MSKLPIQEVQAVGGGTTEAHTEIVHEHALFAEPLFSVGQLTVTNAMLTSWIIVAVIVVAVAALRRKLATIPRGMQNIFEMVVDGALAMADSVTGSRKKTRLFFPFVFSLFIFILLNNWLGIFPGIGSIGGTVTHGGETIFIPFFRGGTADLNMTLALALLAITLTHVFGVVAVGAWQYLNKFVNINALIEIPKRIMREPTIVLVNPIKFFVGVIEIVGEVAKVVSLSFRLFGNIFAGEVLLASIAAMAAFIAPIPFMFLELLVGVVQALVFAMLTLVFLTIATDEHH